jgi:hypothetical protein
MAQRCHQFSNTERVFSWGDQKSQGRELPGWLTESLINTLRTQFPPGCHLLHPHKTGFIFRLCHYSPVPHSPGHGGYYSIQTYRYDTDQCQDYPHLGFCPYCQRDLFQKSPAWPLLQPLAGVKLHPHLSAQFSTEMGSL